MKLFDPTNSKIAFAHLTSRLKQTLVAVLSVTFGISMYVFMNGFMGGVNDTLTEISFSALAHIHVFNEGPEDRTKFYWQGPSQKNEVANIRHPKVIQYTQGIDNSQKYINTLEKNPAVTVVAPEVNVNVFFRNGSMKVNGMLSGIYPEKGRPTFQDPRLCGGRKLGGSVLSQ